MICLNTRARMPANRYQYNQKVCPTCFDHCYDIFRGLVSSNLKNTSKYYENMHQISDTRSALWNIIKIKIKIQ